MSNKLLYFFVYELIYMLFGNNNFVWKFQLRYVGLLVELSISSSNVYCCCFYCFDSFYKHCFSLGWYFLFFFVNQGGSLSSMVNDWCGIKLEIIFKSQSILKVLFRMNTFSLTLVFTKALSQSNIAIARLIRSVFASW